MTLAVGKEKLHAVGVVFWKIKKKKKEKRVNTIIK